MAAVTTDETASESPRSSYDDGFKYVAGRRFHTNPDVQTYILPNDSAEHARLDKLQFMIRSIYGGNVLPSICKNPRRILDCGTGSGRWPVEVANEFPSAEVLGMDISPVTVTDAPRNCSFRVGNIVSDLSQFGNAEFDLVHSRLVMIGIKKEQWPAYIAEAFRILKPGVGWAQFSETSLPMWDKDLPEDSAYLSYLKKIDNIVKASNCFINGAHLEQLFVEAGFVDIKVIKKVIDIGHWRPNADKKHAYLREISKSVYGDPIPAIGMALVEEFPDEQERWKFGEAAKCDFQNSGLPLYTIVHMVIGRKPGNC